MGQLRSERYKRKKRSVTRWVACGLLVVLVALGIYLWVRVSGMTRGQIAVATMPADLAGLVSAEPQPTLKPLETEPPDIDVDYDVDISPDKALADEPIYKQVPIDEEIVNILLIGVDARPGEQRSRSDTTMLVSYNRVDNSVKLISLLRDTWIQIPGHSWNRINAAHVFGGIGLTANTININFDLDVQKYVSVRFEQFAGIVDALGGVDVKLTEKEIAYINAALPTETPISVGAGIKLLNGKQALTHCRNRKTGGGDFERTRRQREFMLAVFTKLKKEKSIPTLTGLLRFALDNVETNISANEIFTLAVEAVAGAPALSSARIPFDKTWKYADKDGRSVIAIDLEKNKKLLHELLYADE